MSAIKIIQALGRKIAAKKSKTSEGITQIQPQIYAESEASNIAQRLVNAGLSMERFDEFIFSEADVVRLLNQIEALEKKNLADNIRSGIRTIEPGKVFDMEGKQIPRGSDIMSGKAVPGTSDRERVRNEMKKKYGFTDERLDEIENTPVDEKMADDLLREDDERIIKERLEKQNKQGIKSLEERMKKNKEYQDLKKSFDDPEKKANGGRIGYKFGTGKKGVEGLLDLVRNKFGKKSITTADKAPIPPKTLERDMFKKADERFKNKQMTDEEVREFADEFGLDPSEEYYNWDGTLADARRLLKESEDETKYMYQQYKAGRLDPKSGEKGREKFLEKKLEEAELSGESKLITRDEIEELEELKRVREMAPKMVERLELKQKYPGITDDLLDKILIDDNPQRKAELLATLDEAFAMMRKGKGPDEVLRIIKDMNRTKQADGGITRIGYKAGSVDKMRRLFLKAIGAGTAGVGAAKSGIFSFGKGAGKEVAKEVVQKSTTTPPPYFFKLAEKIKKLGSDTTPTNDRTIAKSLKSKDGTADYILEEDMVTGDIQIKKVNMENDDMTNSIEIMELRKGEVVQGKDGKAIKTPDEYDEVTESHSRIYKDNFNDPDYSEGIRVKEVMEEVMDAPSIKKAGGGIARMLGE
jgi:hypothetical protein